LWDRNRGNILQTRNQLLQAVQQSNQTKLQLTSSLAEAYNRYRTAHEQVRSWAAQIEMQVQVYRSIYGRYREVADTVTFGDVVTAQQTLASMITTYVTALGLQ